MMNEVTLKDMEEVILILPNGLRVSVVYEGQPDIDAVPELDIHFGEENLVMCNTWAYGHDNLPDNPNPTVCNQIVVCIGELEDE